MTVEDVFSVRNRGVVVTGRVEQGTLRVGDTVYINGGHAVTVTAIERFRKRLDEAVAGENVGVVFADVDKSRLNRGDVITTSGEAPAIESTTIIV